MNKRNYIKTILGAGLASFVPLRAESKIFDGVFDKIELWPFFGDSILKFYNNDKVGKLLYLVTSGPEEHRYMMDITDGWSKRTFINTYKIDYSMDRMGIESYSNNIRQPLIPAKVKLTINYK